VSDVGDQVVHEFEAGRQTIRASVSHFRGDAYVDLRVWYEPEAGQELRPTKKGVRVPADYLDDLREAVEALTAAVATAPNRPARRRAA
jgi:transcriptional coactivator p15 (PC4)